MCNINDISEVNLKKWSEFLEKSLQIDCTLYQLVYGSVMFIIFVVSLFGNSLICCVIYSDKSMHTATNYYLFNLAASDIMLTFAITIEIFQHLIYQNSQLICLIQWFAVACLWNNSILTITALSVERYVAIWHPLLLKSTPVWQRVLKVISLLWLLAIMEALPELLTVNLIRTSESAVCFTIPSPLARILNGVLGILTFVLPLIIMVFVYSMIIFKVNIKQKKISSDNVFNHRDPRRRVNGLMSKYFQYFSSLYSPLCYRQLMTSMHRHRFRFKASWSAGNYPWFFCSRPAIQFYQGLTYLSMFLLFPVAMTVSFFVCWTPFFMARVLLCIADDEYLSYLAEWWTVVFKFININSWFSVVLNPILFSLMSSKFQKSLKHFWNSKIRRTPSV
ncbi:neuropeptides capa receptor-like isoform X1 [Choristoneura fumiferana]|uniref:neuropeptides capa receptor-like isoform X1 n=1 Tax=Choristoneura fumiferana TaxID=7141 RepID=UPI003D15474F